MIDGMKFRKKTINEFQKICREDFGEPLQYRQAEHLLQDLIEFKFKYIERALEQYEKDCSPECSNDISDIK